MLYFIPAWYQETSGEQDMTTSYAWKENEQNWYIRRQRTEFDDAVKQVQLFHRNSVSEYRILLLGYSPNFRHFLHRQSVLHAPYWSVFDAIQEVNHMHMMVLSYHDIMWPKGVEFIYTPFYIEARLGGRRYAKIEIGEDGNPIEIHMYQQGQLVRSNIYDDRGFVSSTVVYENGIPVYRDYLAEDGRQKMRHFFRDDHVEISEEGGTYQLPLRDSTTTRHFKKKIYISLEDVIAEVLESYLTTTKTDDIFCVAMHPLHQNILERTLTGKKHILSFYEERFPAKQYPDAREFMENADYIITDLREKASEIHRFLGEDTKKITDLTPYDSRVDFGISQQLSVQKILVPVDGMSEEAFLRVVEGLGRYLQENDKAEIHLFTRNAEYHLEETDLERTREALQSLKLPVEWAIPQEKEQGAENRFMSLNDMTAEGTGSREHQRFFVEQCVDEREVSKCMREQRLLVDMRPLPELYLQITAISIGIPQIVSRGTQFVEDGKNGMVLNISQSAESLTKAAAYYLDGLKNWNDAMVEAYELGKKYSTPELIRKWKEVIETVG